MTLTERLDVIESRLPWYDVHIPSHASDVRYLLAVARAAEKLETALDDAGHYGEEDEAKTCVQCAALAEFRRVAGPAA